MTSHGSDSTACRAAFDEAGYWPNDVMWKAWRQAWDAALKNAAPRTMDGVVEQPPEGWQQITFPESQRTGLCHSDGPWWESPQKHWYCATCHPTPWRGLGFVHSAAQELYYQQQRASIQRKAST